MRVVRADPVGRRCRCGAIAVVDQNVAHVAVTVHAQFQRQRTRRFETFAAIATGEREQSEARPIAVFRVALLLQQPGDEGASCRADLLAPVNQPLRRPFQMGAVCGRHVLDDGGVATCAVIAGVAGNTAAAMQQLDSARRDARIELEAN